MPGLTAVEWRITHDSRRHALHNLGNNLLLLDQPVSIYFCRDATSGRCRLGHPSTPGSRRAWEVLQSASCQCLEVDTRQQVSEKIKRVRRVVTGSERQNRSRIPRKAWRVDADIIAGICFAIVISM